MFSFRRISISTATGITSNWDSNKTRNRLKLWEIGILKAEMQYNYDQNIGDSASKSEKLY